MSEIDQIDERLMELLGEDAHQSSEKLASRLSISPATARRRVQRLVQSGALRIIAIPNPCEIGLNLIAMIALKVDRDKIDAVLAALSERPRCAWVVKTLGVFDVVAIEWFRCAEDLSDFMEKDLAKMEGVRDIATLICLHTRKGYMRRT